MIKIKILKSIGSAAFFMPAIILTLTTRGFFRAWFAKIMGDNTAYEEGFLSLNPAVHIDAIGLVIFSLVLFVVGGIFDSGLMQIILIIMLFSMGIRWGYDVPIDESRFKNVKRGIVITSIAGLLGNCLLALVFLYIQKYFIFDVPLKTAIVLNSVYENIINLSLFWGVIHMLPILPLDGGHLFTCLLPSFSSKILSWIESSQFNLLLMLVLLVLFSQYIFLGLGVSVMVIKYFLMLLVI